MDASGKEKTSYLHHTSNPVTSKPYRTVIPTVLSRPLYMYTRLFNVVGKHRATSKLQFDSRRRKGFFFSLLQMLGRNLGANTSSNPLVGISGGIPPIPPHVFITCTIITLSLLHFPVAKPFFCSEYTWYMF